MTKQWALIRRRQIEEVILSNKRPARSLPVPKDPFGRLQKKEWLELELKEVVDESTGNSYRVPVITVNEPLKKQILDQRQAELDQKREEFQNDLLELRQKRQQIRNFDFTNIDDIRKIQIAFKELTELILLIDNKVNGMFNN